MPLHAPRRLDGVGMSACTPINKADAVIAGAVRITLRVEIPVRRPAIIDDRSAGFDPCIYNGHQNVSGSVRNGNEKLTGLALNTAKHPLPLNRVAPMIFAPTELAHIDVDGLLKIADLLRAALQVHQHGPSRELTSVIVLGLKQCSRWIRWARYTAHDVVCGEHNLLESEVTLLTP